MANAPGAAWPPGPQRNAERLLGNPWAVGWAAAMEAWVWPVTGRLPPVVTFIVVYAALIVVRAWRLDAADRAAEKPVVALRPYSGLSAHHHPDYRPAGSLLRNLPVESGGTFYHVNYHVVNEGQRGALLEAEGRAEGRGGGVVLSHALWSVLESASAPMPRVEEGMEFLPVPPGAHLRAMLSVYVGPKAASKTKSAEQLEELKRRCEAGEPWGVNFQSMQEMQFWVWDRLRRPKRPIKVQVPVFPNEAVKDIPV